MRWIFVVALLVGCRPAEPDCSESRAVLERDRRIEVLQAEIDALRAKVEELKRSTSPGPISGGK